MYMEKVFYTIDTAGLPSSTKVFDLTSTIHDENFKLAKKLEFPIEGLFNTRRYEKTTMDNIILPVDNAEKNSVT